MTSVTDRTANAERSWIAVLCGVEALSAQRWVAGAISLCANGFAREAGPDGEAVPGENLRKDFRANV
jgi:hypothetical protein